MCLNCYQEYGSPVDKSPAVMEAVGLIERVYKHSAIGGNLHIQLDDWNLEDEHFEAYEKYGETPAQQENAERLCFSVLARLTLSERASAMALYEGFNA